MLFVIFQLVIFLLVFLKVIEKAERERVGKIIERVEKIKQRATDFGPHNCR